MHVPSESAAYPAESIYSNPAGDPILKHPAAKIEHFGIENCKTLTLEILFSHFEKGRGYCWKSGTIFKVARSENIIEQPLVAVALVVITPHKHLFLGTSYQ